MVCCSKLTQLKGSQIISVIQHLDSLQFHSGDCLILNPHEIYRGKSFPKKQESRTSACSLPRRHSSSSYEYFHPLCFSLLSDLTCGPLGLHLNLPRCADLNKCQVGWYYQVAIVGTGSGDDDNK